MITKTKVRDKVVASALSLPKLVSKTLKKPTTDEMMINSGHGTPSRIHIAEQPNWIAHPRDMHPHLFSFVDALYVCTE